MESPLCLSNTFSNGHIPKWPYSSLSKGRIEARWHSFCIQKCPHNLWGPMCNENGGPLIQKLFEEFQDSNRIWNRDHITLEWLKSWHTGLDHMPLHAQCLIVKPSTFCLRGNILVCEETFMFVIMFSVVHSLPGRQKVPGGKRNNTDMAELFPAV